MLLYCFMGTFIAVFPLSPTPLNLYWALNCYALSFCGKNVPTCMPLNQFIVILQDRMLNKSCGGNTGPLTLGLSGAACVLCPARQTGQREGKSKCAEPHISSCRQPHAGENRGKYICPLCCQKALALSREAVRAGTSVNGQESIKLISLWLVSAELRRSINPV